MTRLHDPAWSLRIISGALRRLPAGPGPILRGMAQTSDPVGLHVALCCGCGSVRVVELSGRPPTALVPRQRAVAPAACDTCGTVTDHAYVSNSTPGDAATATVRRLVRRLAEMGVVVGHLSEAPGPGARAVVVELADGWRGIALRPGLASADVVSTLRAAGAALFSEDGWVTAPTGGRSVTLG
jgi:hypothetical protein